MLVVVLLILVFHSSNRSSITESCSPLLLSSLPSLFLLFFSFPSLCCPPLPTPFSLAVLSRPSSSTSLKSRSLKLLCLNFETCVLAEIKLVIQEPE